MCWYILFCYGFIFHHPYKFYDHHIYELNKKHELLTMLKNKDISEKTRENAAIKYLEENRVSNKNITIFGYNEPMSKYAENLFGGGLLDDWNFS